MESLELKFELIKPNMYIFERSIYVGMDYYSVIPFCEIVDNFVEEKGIGSLKTKEEYFDIITKEQRIEVPTGYTFSFKKYLEVIKEYNEKHNGLIGVFNPYSNLFGIQFIADACNYENLNEISLRNDLKMELDNFEGFMEDCSKAWSVNKKRTLKKRKKIYDDLEKKMPKNIARLHVIPGKMPVDYEKDVNQYLGVVDLFSLESDEEKIKETDELRDSLTQRLDELKGPCLSQDVPLLCSQILNVESNSERLVNNFGDILINKEWKRRFFKYDP